MLHILYWCPLQEISVHAFLNMHARFAVVKSKSSKNKANIQTSISKFFTGVNKKSEGDSANNSGINPNNPHIGVRLKVNTQSLHHILEVVSF